MPRPQFTLKSLLWLMALVAIALGSFSAGRRFERQELKDQLAKATESEKTFHEIVEAYEQLMAEQREQKEMRRQPTGAREVH